MWFDSHLNGASFILALASSFAYWIRSCCPIKAECLLALLVSEEKAIILDIGFIDCLLINMLDIEFGYEWFELFEVLDGKFQLSSYSGHEKFSHLHCRSIIQGIVNHFLLRLPDKNVVAASTICHLIEVRESIACLD